MKNDDKIYNLILNELNLIGFNLNHLGTYMIADSIYKIYTSNDVNLIKNISKNIYESLIEKYSKKLETIKSDIAKATNYIKIYGNKENMKKYCITSENISPKLVILSVVNKIKILI